MATVWIQRQNASDILIYFDTLTKGRTYAIQYFLKYTGESSMTEEERNSIWFNDMYSDENGVYHVGDAGALQVSFMVKNTIPPLPKGLTTWNTVGTVLVTPEEAILLGMEGEPEGFIPYESEGLWTKETRSAEELDRELDTYMQEVV